jgi:hypothetical protein
VVELVVRVGRNGFRGAVTTASAALVLGVLMCAPAAGAPFFFSTGNPDGLIALGSRPASSVVQIEAADDFVVSDTTSVTGASFTGLLPTGAGLPSIQQVQVEIYRGFPTDSDLGRTSGPPLFSTAQVPTRVNSPSDVDLAVRDSADGGLSFVASIVSGSFTANNSVLNGIHPKPNETTGGEGPVTGEEVAFNAVLNSPIELTAGHYFFVPQVKLSAGDFLWLSAPRPILAPGTPFPVGSTDLQAWIRDAHLAPDWLRVGTDIVGGATPPTFNAAFALSGATCAAISISPTSVPAGTTGSAYTQSFVASGGAAPYRFTETGGLPVGLSLGSSGSLAGTPSQAGSFPIVLTATDADGCSGTANVTITVASAPPGGPQGPPMISSARLSHTVFRAARRGPALARKRRHPLGTTVSYRDSEPAITTLAVLKLAIGHKRGHRCIAGRGGKHHRRCTRRVAVGSFLHTDVAGNVRIRFTGRLRGRTLKPARYALTLTPNAHGQQGSTVTLLFQIVK